MRQSLRIIEQILDGLPEGEVLAKGAKVLRPPVVELNDISSYPGGILEFTWLATEKTNR